MNSVKSKAALARAPVFRVPLILGIASAVGLISALLADGVWDAVSWVTLAMPLLAVAWACRYRRQGKTG